MTPLHMKLMIEGLHMKPGTNMPPEQWNSPAAQEYRASLVDDGLLQEFSFRLTDKGKAWLEKALSTPMPVQRWVFEEQTPDFIGSEAA